MRYVALLIGTMELKRKLNHPAKCAPPSPTPMRASREGLRGSVLFHPTSRFARAAVAKNGTILPRYRKGLMRRDQRNWSARLRDVLDPGSVEHLSPD